MIRLSCCCGATFEADDELGGDAILDLVSQWQCDHSPCQTAWMQAVVDGKVPMTIPSANIDVDPYKRFKAATVAQAEVDAMRDMWSVEHLVHREYDLTEDWYVSKSGRDRVGPFDTEAEAIRRRDELNAVGGTYTTTGICNYPDDVPPFDPKCGELVTMPQGVEWIDQYGQKITDAWKLGILNKQFEKFLEAAISESGVTTDLIGQPDACNYANAVEASK